MGIFNLFLSSSIGIGPLGGGWLSDTYGMAASFYCMGGLNALAFLLVFFFLPEARASAHAAAQPSSYRALLRGPKVRGLALYRMVNAIQMGLWFSFMPLLAAEGLRLSKAQIGSEIAVHMLVSSFVQVPSGDRKSTRLNSSHGYISYAVFCLKKKKNKYIRHLRVNIRTYLSGKQTQL